MKTLSTLTLPGYTVSSNLLSQDALDRIAADVADKTSIKPGENTKSLFTPDEAAMLDAVRAKSMWEQLSRVWSGIINYKEDVSLGILQEVANVETIHG